MNGLDLALVGVVAASVLFAFARGVVRELIGVATWVAALIAAFAYAAPVATLFGWLDVTPPARHVLAFASILVLVLIVGATISHLLSGVVRAIGLGFVDRFLGALFGFARGLAVLVLFALIAGLTTLPQRDWWQNSTLGRPLAEAALALRPYLPQAWADGLDFSPDAKAGRSAQSAAVRGSAVAGVHRTCVES